jgi:hypothetical protein
VIDVADIRGRWRKATAFLDERARRLFAANEALAQGHGGVSATAIATGLARSTINRGIQEAGRAGEVRYLGEFRAVAGKCATGG